MNNSLSLSDIDQIRNQGYRPQVVGCFVCNQKILFLFKKEHDLWQLPQGGIDNGENIESAFGREMAEELGEQFVKNSETQLSLVGDDQVEFPPSAKGSRELKNDQGQEIIMQGKRYFFIAAAASGDELDITKTEFDDFKWVTFDEAIDLCETIYQSGKKRITLKVLKILRELKLL